MEKRTINILGTEYEAQIGVELKDEPRLKDCDGFTDFTTKKIFIGKFIQDGKSFSDLETYTRKVIRHEVVHAFLFESGLDVNSDWARNEELVDWIAIQSPKLNKVFQDTHF